MTIAELFNFPEMPEGHWESGLSTEDAATLREIQERHGLAPLGPPPACQPEQFSHAEALAITGVSRGLLFTWYQRGYLDRLYGPAAKNVRFKSKPGRGHRRRYNLFELALLLALKTLVDVDLPIPVAVEHALEITVWMVDRIFKTRDLNLRKAARQLAEGEDFGVVAIYASDHAPLGGWHFSGYAGMVLFPRDSVATLHKWFQQDSLPAIRLVDQAGLAAQLLRRTAEVLTKRK